MQSRAATIIENANRRMNHVGRLEFITRILIGRMEDRLGSPGSSARNIHTVCG
jgi:hypothetical protein